MLERFKIQLENFGLATENSMKPNFSWACVNVDKILNKFIGKKFILIFPFCSPKLSHKKWPHYNELIKIIKSKHMDFEFLVSPSNNEIEDAKTINAISVTDNNQALNIMQLAGLIKKSTFVISNDTGPAHMAAHLGKNGLVLFGHHTTPKKVSIETDKFKAISVANLNDLSAEYVYEEFKKKIESIN